MRYLLIALSAFLFVSCNLPDGGRPSEEQMIASRPLDVPGREIIWIWLNQELESAGFRLDSLHSNAAAGEFETQWDALPSPQRYNGIRRKIVGVIVEPVERPGTFVLKLAVWRQRNTDINNPMETSQADWEDEEPDAGMAELIIYRIESRLEQ